jgi:hypothetical protein
MRLRIAALCLALGLAPAQSQAQTAVAARGTLVCMGSLAQAQRMDWNQRGIEFALDYAQGMQVSTLKSNFEALNGALLVELDEVFLRARQAQPRPLASPDRSIAISELRISRNTGQFSLAVALFRDLDVLEGRSLWEGICTPKGASERKF